MGRKYCVQADARVREKGNRRTARISTFVSSQCSRIEIGRERAIVGIDVGENRLDLAIIDARRRTMRFEEIALSKFGGDDPIGALADALAEVAPELCDGAIAIVDSPRSPLDLDCSTAFFRQMVPQ